MTAPEAEADARGPQVGHGRIESSIFNQEPRDRAWESAFEIKKVVVDGQEVFLCCAGCEEELHKDPQKYLAKLKSE